MPVQFTIDHARRFVDVRGIGVVVVQDIIGYFDALVTDGGMPYRKMIDLRGVTAQCSDDSLLVDGCRPAVASGRARGLTSIRPPATP